MKYPIHEEYSAVYRDAHGEEKTVVRNDGRELRMMLRGVEFVGKSPTGLEPAAHTSPDALLSFSLNTRSDFAELCDCEIKYDVPMPLFVNGALLTGSDAGVLRVTVILGLPDKHHMLDVETLRCTLTFGGQTYQGPGGDFESELLDIQKVLPDGVAMFACINCAYSDYSPFGCDVFGTLMCFRDNKHTYLQVKTKRDMIGVEGTCTETVQETYRCPEFARRAPGTGYRG